jgi:hypothetical protein
MSDQPAEQGLDPLVEEAQSHGYLTIDGSKITYHCGGLAHKIAPAHKTVGLHIK